MKAFMNWSGGKDSALALYHAQKTGLSPELLSTNVNGTHNRISMHGVRRNLLEQQAKALGLPLITMELPEEPAMLVYEEKMNAHVALLKQKGFTDALFGDIFLEDLKQYREKQLKHFGIHCHFPLWKRDSLELMKEFISLGFKAVVVCVNDSFLDKSFCGRLIDESFVNDLPANVDVCGENGEYHSFVFDGPIFSEPVTFSKGEIITRNYKAPNENSEDCFTNTQSQLGFYFCDLFPRYASG
jgi:uncharacterized protein (TIGR00290 family)